MNKHFTPCETDFLDSRYDGIPARDLYKEVEKQGCEKFKYYISNAYLCGTERYRDIKDMANDYVRIGNVDTSIPIILMPSGWICEGQHRVARAIADGLEYIWAYRLKEMPDKKD